MRFVFDDLSVASTESSRSGQYRPSSPTTSSAVTVKASNGNDLPQERRSNTSPSARQKSLSAKFPSKAPVQKATHHVSDEKSLLVKLSTPAVSLRWDEETETSRSIECWQPWAGKSGSEEAVTDRFPTVRTTGDLHVLSQVETLKGGQCMQLWGVKAGYNELAEAISGRSAVKREAVGMELRQYPNKPSQGGGKNFVPVGSTTKGTVESAPYFFSSSSRMETQLRKNSTNKMHGKNQSTAQMEIGQRLSNQKDRWIPIDKLTSCFSNLPTLPEEIGEDVLYHSSNSLLTREVKGFRQAPEIVLAMRGMKQKQEKVVEPENTGHGQVREELHKYRKMLVVAELNRLKLEGKISQIIEEKESSKMLTNWLQFELSLLKDEIERMKEKKTETIASVHFKDEKEAKIDRSKQRATFLEQTISPNFERKASRLNYNQNDTPGPSTTRRLGKVMVETFDMDDNCMFPCLE